VNHSQLTEIFEASQASLKSYILRITASVPDTEDIVQDTYIKASEKLHSFKGKSSLKTWLFAIASNLAKDNLRARKRWPENITDIARAAAHTDPHFFEEAMQIKAISPQAQFEIREHITFCFSCISKSLPLEQQLALLLKEVYAFKVSEIAAILDNTEAMIKYYLYTSRTKMMDIYDGRCALINKEGVCHQCSELNGIYNPKQQFQQEAMKIEMVKEAGLADRERLFDLRMKIVQAIDPFESGAADLQLHHLEHNRRLMEDYQEKDIA
jgi:RNA polymerase sigma-70 factor (ECF subfamily)